MSARVIVGLPILSIIFACTTPGPAGPRGADGAQGPPGVAGADADAGSAGEGPQGTTLLEAITGTSTWSVQVSMSNPSGKSLDVIQAGTVTFTESAPGQGSYTTSAGNVMFKEGIPGLGDNYVSDGKYFIVDDVLFVSAKTKSGGLVSAFSYRVAVSDGGNTMSMLDGILLKFTKN